MIASSRLPEQYHIVWLDKHIGDLDQNRSLKRVVFSHVDPQTYQVIPFSDGDRDIGAFIASDRETPGAFESDHFTLRTFTEEEPCLNYIEQVQNDRILFIASSSLGKSAVKQMLERYPNSFVNKTNGEKYSSIYIFCANVANAAEWAMEYVQYIKLFDNEADLLARMTSDLDEEFVEHGRLLRSENKLQDALDRFSWARSMFIRHEKLLLPCSWQPSTPEENAGSGSFRQPRSVSNRTAKPSKLVASVDALIEKVEQAIKEEQATDESDQVRRVMLVIASFCTLSGAQRR